MSYKAVVARISTRPLPGADKLLIGSCGAYQVIVGIGTEDGQLGVFFESDGQLSEEFAKQNDLIRRKNDDGTPAGGMFEENRRVKAIKLRGARSEGFWCPLSNLAYTGSIDGLKEGDQFDELNGHKICNKYFTPATQRQSGGRSHRIQRDNKMFHKHVDTGMFKRESHLIPDGSLIYITEKLHGTSARIGNVLDDVPIKRSWIGRLIAKLFGLPTHQKQWVHLVGTRNVILEHNAGTSFYGDETFRYECIKGLFLHKGEVVYGEIVGYAGPNTPIMATQDTAALKDKRIKEQFGDKMVYSYGCLPGTCKFYIYRITQVNEDGHTVELSWLQVMKRAKDLGVPTVPLLHRTVFHERPLALEDLVGMVEYSTESSDGPYASTLDKSHIREGVVVRYESEHGVGWLKNKSFVFGCLEGYQKESDDFVDTEEAS